MSRLSPTYLSLVLRRLSLTHDRGGLFLSILGVFVIVMAVGWLFVQLAIWQPMHLVSAAGCFILLTAVISGFWSVHHGSRPFGQANQVTMLRAGFACLIASPLLIGEVDAHTGWPVLALIAIALALDAIDGYLARRHGLVSEFGARFDVEIDALLLLILSLLVWQSGRVGPWVLAIGLIRYVFVAAGWCLTRLAAPLRPSMRRQSVAAFQGVVLLACMLPILNKGWAPALSATALAALLISFGLDLSSLLRAREGRADRADQQDI